MKLAFDIFTFFAVSDGCALLFGGDGRLAPLPANLLTRLHALTKVDNLGLGLVVLGLLPQSK